MKRKKSTVNINILILFVLIFSFFAIVIKLSFVALAPTTDGIDLTAFVNNRNTEKEILKAQRGAIYSSDGETLAQNVTSYKVIAILSETRTKDSDNPQHVVDKEKTAEELFIHENTIRYRIKQIEEIMGCDLRDVNTITDIVTALKVRRMIQIIEDIWL